MKTTFNGSLRKTESECTLKEKIGMHLLGENLPFVNLSGQGAIATVA